MAPLATGRAITDCSSSNGLSFVNCYFTRVTNTITSTTVADSNGTTNGNVAWINCSFDANYITPSAGVLNSQLLWEYGNSNLTDTAAVTFGLGVGDSAPALTSTDARLLAAQNATTWLNGWVPQLSPNILTNPVSQSASYGQAASFTVSATGIPNPNYQWLFNGSPISNATNATYTIASAGRTNGGNYSVVVTNSSGTVTSSVAQLTYLDTAPVAQTMTVSRTAGLMLIIAWSSVATNWSDVDGDTVTLSSINLVTTNGVNLATTGNSILYTNSPNVNDQISYGISDGFGGTNIGYINIVIQSSVTGTNSITGITPGGTNVVNAFGIPGYNYILERATNLAPAMWIDVSTNPAATNGVINATDNFQDLGGTPPASAYYRLKWQP